MNRTSVRAGTLACALLTSTSLTLFSTPAFAQAGGSFAPPPVREVIDENGVDVLRLKYEAQVDAISIGGSGNHGLSLGQTFSGSPGAFTVRETTAGTLEQSGSTIIASIGDSSDSFTQAGTVYTNTEGNGATLSLAGAIYTYTNRNGVIARFDDNDQDFYGFYASGLGRLIDITYPDGTKTTFTYRTVLYCGSGWENGGCPGQIKYANRVQSITNSNGYQLKFGYSNNDSEVSGLDYKGWASPASVTAFNNGIEYCDPATDTCSPSGTWPAATFGSSVAGSSVASSVTDSGGRTTVVTTDPSAKTVSVKRPGSSSNNIIVNFLDGANVSSITRDGVTFIYAFSDAGSTRTTTVTNPNGGTRTYVGDTATFRISSFKDELNRVTSYLYDSNGRVVRTTLPEGNYVEYNYDTRGNVTSTRKVAKSGSGLADIVTSANFDGACSNAKTCNSPNSVTDALGRVTDLTYDASHGGVLTITSPSASSGGIRPQTRYSYAQRSAFVKQSAGGSPAANPAIYKLVGVSSCQSQASCASASDEVKTSIAYGAQSAGMANNLLPVSVSKGDGTGSLTATHGMAYDNVGNLLTVDGPLAGTADTTRYRYDAARQLIGTVGPDPDGTGPRKPLAQRKTFRPDGQISKLEVGNTLSQSDADWAGFTAAEVVDVSYDGNSRQTTQKLSAGATDFALTQTSYDGVGRPECIATRMNPAAYASLPTSACGLGTTGANGPDRIAKTVYDAAGQVSEQRVAVGTSDEAAERGMTYTGNGRLQTLADGENNKTTYVYDGFDRLAQTQYPGATKGAGASNSSDYEQLGYDAQGNVTSRRNRAGEVTTFSYDALNRVTMKDLPGSEPDVTYDYDLLGQLKVAMQSGAHVAFNYDALGRKYAELSPLNPVLPTYDLAGRRDSVFVGAQPVTVYDRDVTGNITAIREVGITSGPGVLATYTYDDLGRRTSVTRGNGTSTTCNYDPVSRLASLTHDNAATANDLTIDSISYNPANQIVGLARSNDTFAWTGHGSGSQASVANGLNQLTSVGGNAVGHDARGNLTSDPLSGKTYTYSSENLLKSASGGVTLSYDPLLRLRQVTGSTTTSFVYDGLNTVGEVEEGKGLVRRYVYGDDVDAPVVWYEGSGNSDRRWFHADERGSIIGVSDATGNMLAINKYDEYGRPAPTNLGRFQYTGQRWIPELSAYDYKARVYSPQLGRFLQADPIGYTDQTNLYSYVRNDPINATDPSGMKRCESCFKNPISDDPQPNDIIVNGTRDPDDPNNTASIPYRNDFSSVFLLPIVEAVEEQVVVVTAKITDGVKDAYCSVPSVGLSASGRGYAILGGGLVFDFAFDPQTGRAGFSSGFDVGIGLGGEVAWRSGENATFGRNVADGFSASLGGNVNFRLGPVAGGASRTLVGPNGPGFGGVSVGLRPGSGYTVNANLGARGGYGGRVVPSCGR